VRLQLRQASWYCTKGQFENGGGVLNGYSGSQANEINRGKR